MTGELSRESDIERLLAIVDQISGDRQASLDWMRRPLKEFKDGTPEKLVLKGHVEDVIAYLDSVSSGFVG